MKQFCMKIDLITNGEKIVLFLKIVLFFILFCFVLLFLPSNMKMLY